MTVLGKSYQLLIKKDQEDSGFLGVVMVGHVEANSALGEHE